LENLKGSNHLEGLGIDRRIISEWISDILQDVVDWIHLAQDKDQRQALSY
jgi:hypothetical protein